MAIEYSKVGWDVAPYKYANPDNMNKMDTGIKSAVDGVNALEYVPKALASNGYGEQSGSRNLADWQKASHNIYTYSDGTASNSSYYQGILQKYYVHGETVRLNYKTNSQLTASAWCAITLYDVSGNYTRNVGASAKTLSVTPNDNEYYASFVLYGQSGVPASAYEEVMFTTDSDTTYEPYYESNKILTEDVNEVQSLKYLGWTVPKQLAVKNVAKVGGGLHQRVGRVDLGTLSWSYYADGENRWFYSSGINTSVNKPSANNIVANVKCSKYTTKAWFISANANDVYHTHSGVAIDMNGDVIIADTSYTDATQFRNAVSGTYLYYELGTSVEIAEGTERCSTATNNSVENIVGSVIGRLTPYVPFYVHGVNVSGLPILSTNDVTIEVLKTFNDTSYRVTVSDNNNSNNIFTIVRVNGTWGSWVTLA